MNPGRRNVIFFWSILGLLALTGVTLVLVATRLGAGLSDDSYFYIQPARSALAGQGLNTSSLFPPFLPFVVTLLGLVGIEPQDGIRLLNAALFGANIALAGILIRRLSGSILFALLGAGLVLAADGLFEVHTWAMSEPLFIFLAFVGMLLLDSYFRTQRLLHLVLGGLTVGLAALTRYVGVSLAAGCVLGIVLFSSENARRRIRDALLVGMPGFLPVVLYVVRNRLVAGNLFGGRPLAITPLEPGYLVLGLNNVLNWFLPGRVIGGREMVLTFLGIGLFLTTTAWYFFLHRPAFTGVVRELKKNPLFWLVVNFNVVYLVLLFAFEFTSGAIKPGESFSNRYLAPVYFSFLVLWPGWLGKVWKISFSFEKAAIVALLLVVFAVNGYRTYTTSRDLAEKGEGYASARWHISETMAYLNNHPDVPVVGTGDYGIYFWTGRLPRSVAAFQSLSDLRAYLRSCHGYLVIVDSMPPDMYGIPEDQLLQGMTLVERFSEGSIYQAAP